MPEYTDVLIVGAGPTGLMLANSLALQGCSYRIIDKLDSPRQISKASGVMPRTLELFQGLGVSERFIEAGNRVTGLTVMTKRRTGPAGDDTRKPHAGAPLMELSFDHLDTPYPFILGLEQFRTEELLTERLRELGGQIERGVELLDFAEVDDGVIPTLSDPRGSVEKAGFRYLVGCDGAHSTVRHLLGLSFEGSEDAQHYVVGYLKIDWDMPSNRMFEFNSPEGTIFGIPLPDGRWSIASEYDRTQWKNDGESEPELEELQQLFDLRSPLSAKLSEPRWKSYFRVNHRQVPRYRVGRAFLAGDAAHIHSPVGGQGMNTGLQDAANLAWKLAFVRKGFAGEDLIESYHSERHPVGRSIVELTSFLQAELNLRSRIVMGLRDEMIGLAGHSVYVRNLASRQLGELSCHYRNSPIVSEWEAGSRFHRHQARHSDLSECPRFSAGPQAGDRAPDAVIVVPHARNGSRTPTLYSLFDPTRYTLLLFEGTHTAIEGTGRSDAVDSREDASGLEAVARGVAETPNCAVRSFIVRTREGKAGTDGKNSTIIEDTDGMIHHRYAARGQCLYLIRPDGYIGYRSEPADAKRLLERLSVVTESVLAT